MSWWTLRLTRARLTSDDVGERTAAVRSLSALPKPHRLALAQQALQDPAPEVVEAAVADLAALRSRDAVSSLLPLLVDERERVRCAARDALDGVDPEWRLSARARDQIVGLVKRLTDARWSVNRGVLENLESIDAGWTASDAGRAAVPQLIGVLARGDQAARDTALELLGRIDRDWQQSDPARAALPKLVQELVDRDGTVREPVQETLGLIDPRWRELEVSRALARDVALRIADPKLPSPKQKALTGLLVEIQGPDAARALLAARCWDELRTVADARIVADLAELAISDRDHAEHALKLLRGLLAEPETAADEALAKVASIPPAVTQRDLVPRPYPFSHEDYLEAERQISTQEVRDRARALLRNRGRADLLVPILVNELLHGETALAQLDKLDPNWPASPAAREAVPRLVRSAVEHSPGDAAKLALAALERIDPEWRSREARRAAETAAIVADAKRPPQERVSALHLLAAVDRNAAVEAAARAVDDEWVAYWALRILDRLQAVSDQRVVTAAIRILRRGEPTDPRPSRSDEASTAMAAVRILAQSGDPGAVPVLAEVLGDARRGTRQAYFELRVAAAEALGQLGGVGAVEALGATLVQTDAFGCDSMAEKAAAALASIGGTRAAELLRAGMNGPMGSRRGPREAIAAALATIEGDAGQRG